MRKPGALAGLHWIDSYLIIRDWGKLVCQLFFDGKRLMGWGLGKFLRVGGVDKARSNQGC